MTDFFKFSKVQAPDLSASASLMRGAQQSIQASTNALSRATMRVNEANVNKDTRIREDNTNQLVSQINQATSLAEVEELQAYAASDAFGTEYENGFYIDAAKVNAALSTRPANIENEYKIKQSIQSKDEGTAVGGYVSGIGSANNKAELDALREDYVGRNYTASGLSKLNSAYTNRLAELETKKGRDLQQQAYKQQLKTTQDRQAYSADLVKMTNIARSKMAVDAELESVDVSQYADDVARQLVEKYKGAVTYDEAKAAASTQLTSWYNDFNTEGKLDALRSLSESQRVSFLTNADILSQVNSTEKATAELTSTLSGNFPIVSQTLTEEPVSPSEFTSLIGGMDIDTDAIATLDPRLQTASVLTGLSTITDEGQLKLRVAQLNENLYAHNFMQTGMQSVTQQAAARYDRKKAMLQGEIDTNIKASSTAQARHMAAQRAGDSAGIRKYEKEIAQLTAEFQGFEKRQDDLVAASTDAASLWRDSPQGEKEINKYLSTVATNRKLGNIDDRLSFSLEFISSTYGIPVGTKWDVTSLTKDYGVPANIAKKAVDAAKKIDQNAVKAKHGFSKYGDRGQ